MDESNRSEDSQDTSSRFRTVESVGSDIEYCNCKIGEACREHELRTFYESIGDRYLGNQEMNQSSTREIAEELNKKIIQANTYETGYDGDHSVNEMYSLFVEDNVPDEEGFRQKLKTEGVNVEKIEESVTSYITVYRHLKNCLDITSEDRKPNKQERIENAEEYIRNEIEDCRKKIRRKIENTDGIKLGEDNKVVVEVSVTDPDGFPSNLEGEIEEFDGGFNTQL